MPIVIDAHLEARLRIRAEAAGVSVEVYIERIADDDEAADLEIEELAIEGLDSGDSIEGTPEYWESKHRRLNERLKAGRR